MGRAAMKATRRGFLGALAAVPFVGGLVKAAPAPVRARPKIWDARRQQKASALLIWKDGHRSWEHDPSIGLGARIFKAVDVPQPYDIAPWSAADSGLPCPVDRQIRQVVFKPTGRFTSIEGTRVPIYEEV